MSTNIESDGADGVPPEMAGWNLALRFGIELLALGGIGLGMRSSIGRTFGWPAAILAVIVAAGIWGVFNVAGDPSRSGRAPVPVSGPTRLGVEALVLGAGTVGYLAAGRPLVAIGLAALVAGHSLAATARIGWLLSKRG